jgi:hypothetical protein
VPSSFQIYYRYQPKSEKFLLPQNKNFANFYGMNMANKTSIMISLIVEYDGGDISIQDFEFKSQGNF